MNGRLRAVFFDVGGTLIRPTPSVGHVYAAVATEHGIAVTAEEMNQAFRDAWRALKRARPELSSSSKEWWRRLVFLTLAGRATDAYFEDLYARFAHAQAWEVFADVGSAVAFARAQGWHVGLISNWDERLRPLLEELHLVGWDSITISCEAGVEKPAPSIFQAALRAAGVAAAESLHIGDSIEEDLRGATAAGLRAALVDRPRAGLGELLAGYAG